MFCHSLQSDWNNGDAHFQRGIVAELLDRRHEVRSYEPRGGWSATGVLADAGRETLDDVRRAFPWMDDVVCEYDADALDLDHALDGADVVIVHERNAPELVARIGARRGTAGGAGFRLLFHETHHRAVSAHEEMAPFDLEHYDGVLASGEVIRRTYVERGWAQRAWTLHEAADTRVFFPREPAGGCGELVWIGDWRDGHRTRELRELLLAPARRLRLHGTVHGAGHPRHARWAIRGAGLRYGGWLPDHRVPESFACHRVFIHVPRRPHAESLPEIRPFEALACGLPLVSAPWEDADGLFRAGQDYLVARDGAEMGLLLREVLHDPELAWALRLSGLSRIEERHTCAHRVDELLAICASLGVGSEVAA